MEYDHEMHETFVHFVNLVVSCQAAIVPTQRRRPGDVSVLDTRERGACGSSERECASEASGMGPHEQR